MSCDLFSRVSLQLEEYVSFRCSLLLFMVGIFFLAGHPWWVRMLKVGPSSLGSGSRELVQVLSRKRMMNGDEGSQSTSVASWGSTALLLGSRRDPGAAVLRFFWLCLGLGPHGTFGGQCQQVSSLCSSPRSNLLVFFLSRSLHTPGRRFW